MTAPVFTIKTMELAELKLAASWAASEGWNPGLNDAECYLTADPSGFLMGYLDDEPIACISVVNYQNSFGFLGFYIVKPEYRGLGYGLKIWQAGMARLGNINIGLDGVTAQQANYQRSGFVLAYRNIRYESTARTFNSTPSSAISTLEPAHFPLVFDYESAFFPAERNAFLAAWLSQNNAHALGYFNGDTLQGYGVIRQCQTGYKIGPLFADNSEVAEQLFIALCNKVDASEPVYLDVPEPNHAALALVEKYQLSACFETARMYTHTAPDLPLERIFGVTSFEIG
jgi:ribosomal protein S18 acetylase RimI-like enzyme